MHMCFTLKALVIYSMMYQVAQSSLSSISDWFIQSKEVHSYNIRHCAYNNFCIEYSKVSVTIKSFAKLGAKVWNSIESSQKSFKGHWQRKFLLLILKV